MQHPFVTGENVGSFPGSYAAMQKKFEASSSRTSNIETPSTLLPEEENKEYSGIGDDDDMCVIDDKDEFSEGAVKFRAQC